MIKRSIYVGLIVSAIVALFAVQRAHAIIIINSAPVQFGPLSLARGQVFRFYLSNPAMMGTCDATLRVYDMMGNMVGRESPPLSAMPGQIEFFDVSFDVLAPTSRSSIIGPTQKMNKVVFRAVAQSLPPGPIAVDMPCVMTAEVFDAATGKTEIFIGNPDLLPASLVGS